MKLLVSETWKYFWYGQVLVDRFRELGVAASEFKEGVFFDQHDGLRRSKLLAIPYRLQRKFRWGPAVKRLNQSLLDRAAAFSADAVLLVRGEMVLPETLSELRSRGTIVVGMNNDNAFSDHYPKYAWRHLRAGIPDYDQYFAYRQSDIKHYRDHGCPKVDLLRSYYIREMHFPVDDQSSEDKQFDVAFIGHWEDDGRDKYIEALLNDGRIRLGLFGSNWHKSPIYDRISQQLGHVAPVYGSDYNDVLNRAKIGLVFLSKINNDTYTRRAFEIPATRTMMLSEYTDDLNSLFAEGKECEYFRSPDEMMEKAQFYISQRKARERIAAASYRRVQSDGHEAIDRARQILAAIHEFNN